MLHDKVFDTAYGNLLTSCPWTLYNTAGSVALSLQILSRKRQSKPGFPRSAQILRISFGSNIPRSRQDWFPTSETSLHPFSSTVALLKF